MRVGIATVPLEGGRCPKWLFEKMRKLAQGIILAIVEEFGPQQILVRLSDPIWFQSLGCVLGFDYNSSGLTTTTLAALKEGLKGMEDELGVFICGGKGKTSRKTPQQIQQWGECLSFSQEKINNLVYASKISAKIDSSCLQDGFQIYHHSLIFTRSGQWTVVQQGMRTDIQKARRYHWLSSTVKKKDSKYNFVEEPHSGIISDVRVRPLNLTSRQSSKNREVSCELVREEPKTFLRDVKLMLREPNSLITGKRSAGFSELELRDVEFHWHPVLKERFDLKRLEKSIFFAKSCQPKNFEQLLALKGIGPKTIRALSLVAEVIYGAKPSYQDPARYSFAVGGKDGTPFFVQKDVYDELLEVIKRGIQKSRISSSEKIKAQKRLNMWWEQGG